MRYEPVKRLWNSAVVPDDKHQDFALFNRLKRPHCNLASGVAKFVMYLASSILLRNQKNMAACFWNDMAGKETELILLKR
jgi:hypothetical protein